MIEAKELRQGNIISDGYKWLRVDYLEPIGEYGYKACQRMFVGKKHPVFGNEGHPLTIDLANADPIPLTPEVLGRIKECANDEIQIVIKGEHNCFITACETYGGYDFTLWQGEKEETADFIRLGTYKYLHQLQNLYFALTGSELTID